MEPVSHNQFEKQIAEAFANTNAEPTLDCISEETLWEFAEQGGKHMQAEHIIAHIASCVFCHQGYFGMAEFQQLSLQSARVSKAELPTWKPTVSFWDRVTLAIAASIEPIFPRQMAWQHATLNSTHEIERQTLVFDDPNIVGSFVRTEDEYYVHIEHGSWSAGTLVTLETVAPDGSVRFSNFYVLKNEWERSALDAAITGNDFIGCMLRLRKLNTGQLVAEEAAPLYLAFQSAIEFDSDLLEAWQNWAESTITDTLSPEIEEIALQIIEWTATNK